MGTVKAILARIVKPLASRKTRVAIVTVAVAYAAEVGLNVSPAIMTTIVGAGVAIILGIAHEDNGAKRAGPGKPAKPAK